MGKGVKTRLLKVLMGGSKERGSTAKNRILHRKGKDRAARKPYHVE